MKTRLGFVSNSSSSSFVLITTEEFFLCNLNTLSEKEKKDVEKFLNKPDKMKIGGNDYIIFSDQYCTEDSDYDFMTDFFKRFNNREDSYANLKDF